MLHLSLIIPCYNEETTITQVLDTLALLDQKILHGRPIHLELILALDGSTDQSWATAQAWAAQHPMLKIITYTPNRGKGYAIRLGLAQAQGDFIGIQDADLEYDPAQYLKLLTTLIDNNADVVYGSRYLIQDQRRILYFWHSLLNRGLTTLTNMFTNLDLTDMETCFKLFTKDALQKILPHLQEDRFGIEPEITIQVARQHLKIYECAITYRPRTYEEGKKISWRDGLHALYCILHYGAPCAPLPMQIILYFFIGLTSALANIAIFGLLYKLAPPHYPMAVLIGSAFVCAAIINYLLCIKILFSHATSKVGRELLRYAFVVLGMGSIDYLLTLCGHQYCALSWMLSKGLTAPLSFGLNFIFRKYVVFRDDPLPRRTPKAKS